MKYIYILLLRTKSASGEHYKHYEKITLRLHKRR